MNITIRDEQPEDIESIETLTRTAFLNGFVAQTYL